MGLLARLKKKYSASKEDDDCYQNTEKRQFEFLVRDVFFINGKGVVVTGEVSLGRVNVNETVYLEKSNGKSKEVIINGIEVFRQIKKTAETGDNVGIVLKNARRKEVFKGNKLYR